MTQQVVQKCLFLEEGIHSLAWLGQSRAAARHGTAQPWGLGNKVTAWKAGKQIIGMPDDTAGVGGGANNH